MPKKITIDDCRKIAENLGGKCLSSKYGGIFYKIVWQCKLGHKWLANFNNIKNKACWCPCCAGNHKLTIEDCQKFAENKGGKCLSEEYIGNKQKLDWVCSEGHTWKACFSHIKNNNRWCPICGGTIKLKLVDCQNIAENLGGKCLTTQYINARTKIDWQCLEGHCWKADLNHIKSGNNWCPECQIGKTQKCLYNIISNIFPKFNILYNYTGFDWLKTIETGKKQELDIYVSEIKLAIEYDGEQHFIPVCFGGIPIKQAKQNFKRQKENDIIKNGKIAEHPEDIRYFIRFNYKEKITKEYVEQVLKENGVI